MKKTTAILLMLILTFGFVGVREATADTCGDCHCADADCNGIVPAKECSSVCGPHSGTYCTYQRYCAYGTCVFPENHELDRVNCHWCSTHNPNCWEGCCTECSWSCGKCNATCESYGTKSCTGDYCGGTKTESCYNSTPCCKETNPADPVPNTPMTIDGYTEKTGTVTLTWTPIASTDWGEECSGTEARGYEVCVSGNAADPCDGKTPIAVTGEGAGSYQASGLTSAINYWQVRAKNKAGMVSNWTSPQNFCYFGSNSKDPLPAQRWSFCDANTHMRSRTCVAGCDCSTISLSEVCQARISGTMFDASYSTDCVTSDPTAAGLNFTLTDTAGTPPALVFLSPIFNGTTNSLGNYAINVYPRATYDFDFAPLSTFFDTTEGPRVFCGTSSDKGILVQDSDADRDCLTQPCTKLTNVSFGFWKVFGGWWQAVGGNVYGAGGVRSYIPPMLPAADQRLILPITGRYGVLSYGTKTEEELGQSTDARVSEVLWEIQNTYQGLRYDYDFYKTRMDIFTQTTWDGSDFSYNDGGLGYEILSHTGGDDVTLGAKSLTSGQKLIILADSNVVVNGDLIVPSGAFLAVIARGNIVFEANVEKAQGWFVAETIDVKCHDEAGDGCDKDDKQFLGEGTFVGWTNILLGRDQGQPNNNQPSEKFTYRKDMLLSIPTPMRVYTRKFTPFIP